MFFHFDGDSKISLCESDKLQNKLFDSMSLSHSGLCVCMEVVGQGRIGVYVRSPGLMVGGNESGHLF